MEYNSYSAFIKKNKKMIFPIFLACFLVSGSPTKIDDFALTGFTLLYLVFKTKINIQLSNIFLVFSLLCVYFINMIRKGFWEANGILVLFSICYLIIIVFQITKNKDLIKNVNNNYIKLQIFSTWILVILYIFIYHYYLPGRINSPGITWYALSNPNIFYPDSHIFSAQVGLLALISLMLSERKITILIVIIVSLIALSYTGSRSGPYILTIGSFLTLRLNKLEEYSKMLWIITTLIIISVITYIFFGNIMTTGTSRAFTVGGDSDVHRFEIIINSLRYLTPLDILIGDEDAFTAGRKYYDNFILTIFLLVGTVGLIIISAGLFAPLLSFKAYKLIFFIITLLPLSDFLLIPRFQIMFIVFIVISLNYWSRYNVYKNS
jgi:hypothetical protein